VPTSRKSSNRPKTFTPGKYEQVDIWPEYKKCVLGFLNLNILGYILMAAGVIGLAATLWLRQRKRVRVLKNGKTIEETTTDV